MIGENKRQPIIDLKHVKRIFGDKKQIDERIFDFFIRDFSKEDNEVCKIQNLNDLPKTKHYFNLVYKFDCGGFCYGLGNKCYLFEDDDEVKIKTMKNQDKVKTFNTKFGLMTAIDRGEWGGYLFLNGEDGEILAGIGNYVHVFEYADKVYALAVLSHLGDYKCSIYEIRKINEGFENIKIFDSEDLSFSGYCSGEQYVYFYSQSYKFEGIPIGFDGLYRFNLENNKLELIYENLCKDILVNSLIKKDNLIYIYGNYNIIQYDLNTREIETYTNLGYDQIEEKWYSGDEKLIDIWDKIVEFDEK